MEFIRKNAVLIALALVTLIGALLFARQCTSDHISSSQSQTMTTPTTEKPAETSVQAQSEASKLPVYTYDILRTIPHDAEAFTEGLLFHDGDLYESTGLYGKSSIRKLDPNTGRVLKRLSLDEAYFGEGIVIVADKLYQLTYQAGIGFVYDLKSFRQLRTFSYFGEGWGLTYNGEHIIMSDGTSSLRFLDPDSLLIQKMLAVTSNGVPVRNLNELEMVNGELWANVWQTDSIARINPSTGAVTGWINCAGLLATLTAEERANADVLNGIAYDPKRDVVLLTIKNCSKMFEVRIRKP
jgi:glutaminyl-peptide cyclotransferase